MKRMPISNATALLLMVMALGAVGRNRLVVIAAGLLLLIQLFDWEAPVLFLRSHGPTLGFVLLVSSLLSSFVKGEGTLRHITSLLHPEALLATLGAGIAASILCKRGMDLLRLKPELIIGLIVGSLAGVLLLRGVPVGPFVAAGITGLVLRVFRA